LFDFSDFQNGILNVVLEICVLKWFCFLDDGKNAKSFLLAPVEVEIIMSRGSGHNIATENRTNVGKNAKSFCSKLIIDFSFPLKLKLIFCVEIAIENTAFC